MLELNDENFEEEVIKSEQLVLVDFWSPVCSPCLVFGPIIEEIAKEFEDRVKVGKLNVLENLEIARQYKIMAIPTLIIFKDGKPTAGATGLRPKQIIVDKLNSLLQYT